MAYLSSRAIRHDYIKMRAALSSAFVASNSKIICNHIKQNSQYREAKHIAIYYATRGEVDITSLVKRAAFHGKQHYMPVCRGEQLLFLPVNTKTEYKKNKYNILEPDVPLSEARPVEQLDIIFLPVVAFDPSGVRLGMGKGYYDKTLASIQSLASNTQLPYLFGVAYQFQKQDILIKNPWDIMLHATLTESQTYWTNQLHY